MQALEDFGFGGIGVTESDFRKEGMVVQLGFPPRRIDVLTTLSGITFAEAWEQRSESLLDGLPVSFLDREMLKANKLAAGRKKDLADVEHL